MNISLREEIGTKFFGFYLTPTDEVHHYASRQFRKLLDYFAPTFMLGITATPYRMDTQNVFELYDYNVVYEADLFVDALKKGEIDVIFAVSMFNEGLDISELDLLLFLRPTESTTVFLQQLGRGLRKAPNKSKVRILDFIGNYKKAGMVPYLLGCKMSSEPNPRKGLDLRTLLEDPSFYPANCRIDFDFQVIDLMEKMIRSQKGLKVQIGEGAAKRQSI